MQSALGPHSAVISRGVWPKSKLKALASRTVDEGLTLSLPLCTKPSPAPTGAQCKAQAEGSKVSGEALEVLGKGVKGCMRRGCGSSWGRSCPLWHFIDAEPGVSEAGSTPGTHERFSHTFCLAMTPE